MKKILLILFSLLLASSVFAEQPCVKHGDNNEKCGNHPCDAEKKEIEGQLKGIWGEMNTKLSAGDIEGTLAFFVEAKKEKYRKTFTEMSRDTLTAMFIKSEISLNEVRADMAECFASGALEGMHFSYPVSFMKDADGKWKINDF